MKMSRDGRLMVGTEKENLNEKILMVGTRTETGTVTAERIYQSCQNQYGTCGRRKQGAYSTNIYYNIYTESLTIRMHVENNQTSDNLIFFIFFSDFQGDS